MTTTSPIVEKQFPIAFARRFSVLLNYNEDQLAVVYKDIPTAHCIAEVRRFLGVDCPWERKTAEEFDALLVSAFETDSTHAMQMAEDLGEDLDLYRAAEALNKTEDLLESQDDAPIIRLINAVLSEAIKRDASDIHIETFEESLSIRFRIDGVLQKVLEPQRVLSPLLISRIKVMAKLDIAEKRTPQDGRIALKVGGRSLDVRVSTMPSSHGERIVLRLLEKNVNKLDLSKLGFTPKVYQSIQHLIHKPHGIILVTGPTGAGKTTTLYAALTELNETSRNILTVEDPVEYDLPGIGQTQVNTKVEMTFAKGLRAILRQDPDVVMIGEVRDLETAEIAIQASLTGHLVLSTLHTNTAIGAVTRLRDMGVESFLLSTSLVGVVAQRLVRLLCVDCKQAKQADASELDVLGLEESVTIYHANGCEKCNQTGYAGRVGIYEIFVVDDDVRPLIHEGAGEQTIESIAREKYDSMRTNAIGRVLSGDTTIEEILRVTMED